MLELVKIFVYYHLPENKPKKSSVADHLLLCNHSASYDDFSILTRDNSKFLLELKESLLIFALVIPLQKTPSRCLERRKIVTLKTWRRHLQDLSLRRL